VFWAGGSTFCQPKQFFAGLPSQLGCQFTNPNNMPTLPTFGPLIISQLQAKKVSNLLTIYKFRNRKQNLIKDSAPCKDTS
jgi:hypothetical protein